jgi:magnesium chelatase family protein
VAARVAAARARALERQGVLNAHLTGEALEKGVVLEDAARDLLTQAAQRLGLSARGYHRLLRVARTIADLAHAAGPVARAHMGEALSYRQRAVGR